MCIHTGSNMPGKSWQALSWQGMHVRATGSGRVAHTHPKEKGWGGESQAGDPKARG